MKTQLPSLLTAMLLTAFLALTATLARPQESEPPAAFTAEFNEPIQLMVGDLPVMHRGYSYPAPALYDLDGDGSPELYAGDLRGTIYIFKKSNGERSGDWSAWEEADVLKDAEGKPIDFNNW